MPIDSNAIFLACQAGWADEIESGVDETSEAFCFADCKLDLTVEGSMVSFYCPKRRGREWEWSYGNGWHVAGRVS